MGNIIHFTVLNKGNLPKQVIVFHPCPGVQSLSKQSDLEAVVKSMTPALLAELNKGNPTSSSTAKPDPEDTKASCSPD